MSPRTASLLDRWQITKEELEEIIVANPSMRGLVLGYVAEFKLRQTLQAVRGIEYLGKSDDHDRKKKGDLNIKHNGRTFTLEVKSLQTKTVKESAGGNYSGAFQCDASDRRSVTFKDGSTVQTTCLLAGEFDILAVNLFAFGEKWQFAFAANADLPRSQFKGYSEMQRKELLATMMKISTPLAAPYTTNLIALCDRIAGERA